MTRKRNLRLRERRQRLGKTQREIANLAGLRYAEYVSNAEYGIGPAENIEAIRRAIVNLESAPRYIRESRRRQKQAVAAMEARIAAQRALWAAVPASPEKAALQAAMLARITDLMDQGEGEAADAIAEFLPADEATAVLDAWLDASMPAARTTAAISDSERK